MSTDNTEVVVENSTPEVVPEQTAPQPSEIEQRAMELGWRPRAEFQGSDDDFIDAKEFVRRQPLFDKIETQSRQLKAVQRTLNEFKTHYTKVNEAAYERAIADLKAQRREALTNGDGEGFERIDEQIKEAEKQREEIDQLRESAPEAAELNPEFVAWTSRNNWYNTVGYMRKFADEQGVRLHQQGLNPADVLKKVEQLVREEFPNKFKNPNKEGAPTVQRGTPSGKSAADEYQLSDVERKIAADFERHGIMTKAEYVASLKQLDKKGRA